MFNDASKNLGPYYWIRNVTLEFEKLFQRSDHSSPPIPFHPTLLSSGQDRRFMNSPFETFFAWSAFEKYGSFNSSLRTLALNALLREKCGKTSVCANRESPLQKNPVLYISESNFLIGQFVHFFLVNTSKVPENYNFIFGGKMMKCELWRTK